jgi:hypothetical protein
MWISLVIWPSLLRWSKFKNTNDIYGWCSVVEVITYKLGLVYRSNVNSRRHFIILKLHEQGYSNKEIANFLNSNGIKPPRTDSFSVRLVWVTIKKLKRRLEKEESMKINILSERLNKPS